MGISKYECEGQISIFDIMADKSSYPAVINELNEEIYSNFRDWINGKEKYEVWEHVKYLGYRYCIWLSVEKEVFQDTIVKLELLKKQYKPRKLELTTCLTPGIAKPNTVSIMLSTFWNDKQRAKNG